MSLQDDENDATTDDWTQQKAPKYEFKTPPKSTNFTASQKVVKKYRKYVKNAEFRRLKSIVPTLAKKNDASKVSFKSLNFRAKNIFFVLQTEILEETIRYIDRLHDQLVTTIRTNGLPQLPTTTSTGKFKYLNFRAKTIF